MKIIIPSHPDSKILCRCLYSIAIRGPKGPPAVALYSERRSDADILRLFASVLQWELRIVGGDQQEPDVSEFKDDKVVLHDPRAIVWHGVYEALTVTESEAEASAYEIPEEAMAALDSFGSNITNAFVDQCKTFPLRTPIALIDERRYVTVMGKGQKVLQELCLVQPGEATDWSLLDRKVIEVIK